MKLSAEGGQAKPVAVNTTGFNPWKFILKSKYLNIFIFFHFFSFLCLHFCCL